MADYYQLLEVPYDATSEVISKKFKKLAVKYHPDKSKDPKHHELFIKINQAYETLKSPESKRKYDLSHNINTAPRHYGTGNSGDDDYWLDEVTNLKPGQFYYMNPGHAPSTGGYAWSHFRTYFASEDLLEKQRQAQMEKIRRDVELKKAREEAERQKELLRRREREKAMKEEMEKMKAYQQQNAQTPQPKDAFESNLYNQRKKQAYRAQWSEPFRPYDNDIFNTNFASRSSRSSDSENKESQQKTEPEPEPEPVEVLEDSEEEEGDMTNESGSSSGSSSTASTVHGKGAESDPIVVDDDMESGREMSEGVEVEHGQSRPSTVGSESYQNQPEVEPESFTESQSQENTYSSRSNKPQPERSQFSTSDPEDMEQQNTEEQPNKRHKRSSFYTDIEDALRPDIGQDDLYEIKDSLPRYDAEDVFKPTGLEPPSKRFKSAEYSNGTTKADTIHIPINKSFIKGHPVPTPSETSSLTMLDFNASPKVTSIVPPTPPTFTVDANMLQATWDRYVQEILVYQQEFMDYRTQIVKYQAERASRDTDLAQVYNSDYDAFKVYLTCLNQDSEVLAKYAEATKQFTQTMKAYQQNCDWVQLTSHANK